MTRRISQRIISVVLIILAIALIVTGLFGVNKRSSAQGQGILNEMRTRSLLSATGEGVVESYVEIAKDEARAKAKAEGVPVSERGALVDAAAEAARAVNTSTEVDYSTVDATALNGAIDGYEAALQTYYKQEEAEQAAYIEKMGEQIVEETEVDQPESAADMSVEGDVEMPMDIEEEQKVDLSGFVPSAQLTQLKTNADVGYTSLGTALKDIYPVLDDDAFATLKDTIMNLVSQPNDDYVSMFDRFSRSGGADAIQGDIWNARMIRYGDDMVCIGVGVAILGLLILFYNTLVKALGLPRLIIGMFFILLCILSVLYDLSLSQLLSNTLVRMGMNSILVLAMVPGIQCGISLNLGLPIGIVGGLLGGLMCIEYGFSGVWGFLFAIAVGVVISLVCGYLYGLLLNRLKGSEMAVTTYVGFSIISLMCIAWLVLPFNSLQLRWPLGTGLRNTLSMGTSFKHILDKAWAFKIGSFEVPTGLLLFMIASCALMWLFTRSKTGVAMQAVGNNPRFAEATGVDVDKMRIIGTVISTILGAIGILVYSQSYGFMQLYTAPRQMGFIAASAILIGGASTSRCKISHVLIGTFLFQGVLTLGMPVANVLVPQSTISETMRILISNGIILYALTKSGGGSRA